MSEQQYRVVADREKGDRIGPGMIQPHDRVTYVTDGDKVLEHLVRIERPVPTTDRPKRVAEASCFRTEPHGPHYWGQYHGDKYTKHCIGLGSDRAQPSPHPPTREQVYQAAQDAAIYPLNHRERTILDAVLALIQNGADRG